MKRQHPPRLRRHELTTKAQSVMIQKLRSYLKDRLADPVSWLAISCVGAWAVSALLAVPPFRMLDAIGFVFSIAEWAAVFSWHRKQQLVSRMAVAALPPVADRWKVAVLVLVAMVTIGLDVWTGSSSPSVWN